MKDHDDNSAFLQTLYLTVSFSSRQRALTAFSQEPPLKLKMPYPTSGTRFQSSESQCSFRGLYKVKCGPHAACIVSIANLRANNVSQEVWNLISLGAVKVR
jgi:hypothetical protein